MAKAEAIGKMVADGRYPHRQTLHVIRPAVRLTAGLPMADATWPSANNPVFRWPGPSAFFILFFKNHFTNFFAVGHGHRHTWAALGQFPQVCRWLTIGKPGEYFFSFFPCFLPFPAHLNTSMISEAIYTTFITFIRNNTPFQT